MADIVSPEKRSLMMAGIRGKNTKPELAVRSGLHALGFRYRLHCASLPGKPDLVFPGCKAVIFVHGCFWHLHDCHLFKWPKSRSAFWRQKITANAKTDENHLANLRQDGWRILVIWECALKGKTRLPPGEAVLQAARWLQSRNEFSQIQGHD
jgi:DNA mismatch endonuclease, patch repair protein